MEGGIDSSHVSFLHRHTMKVDPLFKGAQKSHEYNLQRPAAALRGGRVPGRPLHRRAPQRRGRQVLLAHHAVGHAVLHADSAARRPSDRRPCVGADRRRELLGLEHQPPRRRARSRARSASALEAGKGIHVPLIPGTFRPIANKDNDYLMDRQAQKDGRSFSGVEGFAMQDASVQESMGPIQDRTRENLVPTDQGIIMARRRLIAAAQGLRKGMQPPGIDPRHQRVRSVSIILPKGVPFSEAAEDALHARARLRPRHRLNSDSHHLRPSASTAPWPWLVSRLCRERRA